MGIATVAVYSEADGDALHVEMADEAWPIGPAAGARELSEHRARSSMRRATSGAEAMHPGYGFLSENADFAEACAGGRHRVHRPAGIGDAGDGVEGRGQDADAAAGVPVVPGYHGDDQDPARLLDEAERIGFPVLIKASAGGGGRGMRIVASAAEFAAALAGGKARGARRLRRRPRADREIPGAAAPYRGAGLRRPARQCRAPLRARLLDPAAPPEGRRGGAGAGARRRTAARDGRGGGRRGAGGRLCRRRHGRVHRRSASDFYFMEMNTRLQVEHPVTEAVTGLDLVEWQLRVAAGEPLPIWPQDQIALRGHAIEARLYAENPERGFLPATGTLHGCACRRETARVETGVREGDTVTPFYDPMIAKIIAWGEDREAARARLRRALAETGVLGVTTNLGFLARVAAQPDLRRGRSTPGLSSGITRACCRRRRPAPDTALAAAALSRFWRAEPVRAAGSAGTFSRGHGSTAGGSTAAVAQNLLFRGGAEERLVVRDRFRAGVDAADRRAAMPGRSERRADGALCLRSTVCGAGDRARSRGRAGGVPRWRELAAGPGRSAAAPPARTRPPGRLTAPMPGRVMQLLVEPGDKVRQGQPLIVIEAMKMEHTVAAPADGAVETVRYAVGDLVEEGAELIALCARTPGARLTQLTPGPLHLVKMAVGDDRPRPSAPEPGRAAGAARRERGLYPQSPAPRRGGARWRLDLLGDPRPDPRAPARLRIPQRARRQRATLLPDRGRSRAGADIAAGLAAVPGLALSGPRGCTGGPFRQGEPPSDRMLAELRALGLI